MKRLLVVTFSAVAVFAFANGAAAQDAQVQKGMKLYTANKCQTCHSIAGKGNKKGPLDEVATEMSAAEIKAWITDPKGMAAKNKKTRKPPMKELKLSADDVDALVAYLLTLKKK